MSFRCLGVPGGNGSWKAYMYPAIKKDEKKVLWFKIVEMPDSFYYGVATTPFNQLKEQTLFIGESSSDYAIRADNGRKFKSNSSESFAKAHQVGDIIRLTLDRSK